MSSSGTRETSSIPEGSNVLKATTLGRRDDRRLVQGGTDS